MSSGFLGIYVSLYDYEAQNDEELTIQQDDLLYVLEKSKVDDWWKVKKRVVDADVEEPQGLIPCTYIEPAKVKSRATALYDYDKQTEEELSFPEGTTFDVYDTSDSNWTLVGIDNQQFGFIPANYIELNEGNSQSLPQVGSSDYRSKSALAMFPPPPKRIVPPKESEKRDDSQDQSQQAQNTSRTSQSLDSEEEDGPRMLSRPSTSTNDRLPATPALADEQQNEEEDAPPMPARPKSSKERDSSNPDEFFKDNFFTWKVYEIDGKRKRKAMLEIGDSQIFITPEGSSKPRDWTIRDLTNYNSEKKHVFLEFKNPIASYEFHAGNKDSADAIISVLADMKGLTSLSALKDIEEASKPSNRPQGKLLYDFDAASPDELTCYEGDVVYIVNDKRSKEWWMVENVATGKKGVVPSNYIKIVGGKDGSSWRNIFKRNSSQVSTGTKKGGKKKSRAEREQDLELQRQREKGEIARRREKEDLAREREELERQRRRQERKERDLRDFEERERVRRADQKTREKKMKQKQKSSEKDISKPNPHRVRTWIDRSGAFKVEAGFLGVEDGKIHLHKLNGVKIAVAAQKLSVEDLEYVERLTGVSLDNYKLGQTKKTHSKERDSPEGTAQISASSAGAVASNGPLSDTFNEKSYEYWFDFFLGCGADPNMCERYARTFAREQMDETVLEDISASLLRSLGLKEGDVLKVMKYLDNKFRRNKPEEAHPSNGGLFNGADGSLKNNKAAALSVASPPGGSDKFEDDAWAIRPASKAQEDKVKPQFTGSIQDLVDIKPMEPTKKAEPRSTPLPVKPVTPTTTGPMMNSSFAPSQMTGSMSMSNQATGAMMPMPTGFVPISMLPMLTGQTTGYIPLQPTGVTMPLTTFGGQAPMVQPFTSFGQQITGGPTMMLPLSTNAQLMPTTTFSTQSTGGLVQLQSTGVRIQKTGPTIPSQLVPAATAVTSFPAMQPTHTGFQPTQQMYTGMQSPPAQQMYTGMPSAQPTQQMYTGAPPSQPMYTGFQAPVQQLYSSNAQPGIQPGIQQTSLPPITFGTSATAQPLTSFGVPQLTGMMANTSLNGQSQPQQQQTLMSQPTGMGFGNGPDLRSQPTGHQANLANATPDNPFGF
ncbi:hypothetical protein FOA43_002836 [Brettanomyces nanus]|uniref:Actin cytoskeleton-regulatory complex protein SLA1 n=1 Tax=Eeniella nana TaxID=13502 RepID=A0A875S165_EENNA|nr:uncharacterized protein FOA43_002836 [Brettanomyces nanus]QPG75481.1 hypothetical protein FOA43_002836 [Brettanomyces nanus]